MLPNSKKTESPRNAIHACTEVLLDMMATFRMYSGKHLNIDRGDFDVEFFKDLHDKCLKVKHKLTYLEQIFQARTPSKKATHTQL